MIAVEIRQIGVVESLLVDLGACPKQGREGAPAAKIRIDPRFCHALEGLRAGDRITVLTWLDRADRSTLSVHPRDDPANPMRGVFSTRSADRPNPVGLHDVEIVSIDGACLEVTPLEALDGTPVIDLKPHLD